MPDVFPADAGVIHNALIEMEASKCIPRGCGGDPIIKIADTGTGAYSPRMRG